jgi:DNA-binding response OmpR family regulator
MPDHLLLIEDEKLLRRSLAFNLEQAGYQVTSASNAEDALAIVNRDPPDLILLDIGLPGMDGLEALRKLKIQYTIPIIFLTARRREFDEALGLELGADDYITKPFDLPVLLARIKAVLRRVKNPAEAAIHTPISTGDLTINPTGFVATLGDRELNLSPREFDLLHALAMEPERVVSVDALLNQVWGPEYEGQPQVVYVHIRWLREKIENDPQHPTRIVTVRGKGYKFIPHPIS